MASTDLRRVGTLVRPRRMLAVTAILLAATFGVPAESGAPDNGTADLIAGMVALDRAYIPVLALSSQNKADASRKAMDILGEQWSVFAGQFGARYAEADWKQGFERTTAVFAHAEELLKNGDLAGGHTTLEEVRDVWVDLRERRSIPYYVDYLNRYHESMEKVSAVTAGRKAATLEAAQVQEVAALLPEAQGRWTTTLAAPFSAAVYGFPAGKAEELRKAEQAVMEGLGAVGQALETGNRDALIRAVDAMKPAYTKTFLMFGDFDRVSR